MLLRRATARAPGRLSTRLFSSSSPTQRQRLLIIGSGWGGYPLLRGVDKKRWDVTVVSPSQYFNFTPLLASAAVGTLEFRCTIEPVRRYTPQVVAYQAWCDKIDWTRKVIECTPATPPLAWDAAQKTEKFTLRWDKLVIAAGAYSQTFGIPGVKEHAHFLKDIKDARAIRTRILECFEQAMQPTLSDIERRNLLNFCIVGGGPTGIEFSAELHDLLHAEFAVHYPSLAKLAKITIYDVAPSILGSFDRTLVEYAEKTFSRDGISIFTSHHVERLEAGKMFVKEKGEVPFGLLVWSTGLAPNPLVESITELKKDARTKSLLTNDHLNVVKSATGEVDPDVWAIGDCAQIDGAVLPATAQVANQKAQYIVKTLNKLVKDPDQHAINAKPFKFENQGSLAYIGDWKAIYDNSSENKDKLLAKESGRVAWLLWRSAYFTMTLSWRNKILVPMYWFLNWIFGRDITRF
uniref:FAD/NAD(P)-binding domain-containing protein n=1 Tax=Mycena chlorophos TaxID=658473 RepID=A0ABQ0LCA8_MYCCL|nr:FAD/NAD(P)-binding domain-containing protein [Mycena chlorophos]